MYNQEPNHHLKITCKNLAGFIFDFINEEDKDVMVSKVQKRI